MTPEQCRRAFTAMIALGERLHVPWGALTLEVPRETYDALLHNASPMDASAGFNSLTVGSIRVVL